MLDARERGFSLVLVLLVIGALSLAATLFLQAVRGYGRTAASIASVVTLEAHADAGVQLAIFDLAASSRDGRRTRRIPIDGTAFHCNLAPGTLLRLQIQDDAGRVDLNVGFSRELNLGSHEDHKYPDAKKTKLKELDAALERLWMTLNDTHVSTLQKNLALSLHLNGMQVAIGM